MQLLHTNVNIKQPRTERLRQCSDTDKQPMHVVQEELAAQSKKTQIRPSQKCNGQPLPGRGFSNFVQ